MNSMSTPTTPTGRGRRNRPQPREREAFTVGRALGGWPEIDRAAGGRCAPRGCRRPAAVHLAGFGFCRDHWPAARRWWLGGSAPAPALDLDALYGRREALDFFNERLAEHGSAPIAEGTFLKMLYETYPTTFCLEPLRLGSREGPVTEGDYAKIMTFTRRMLVEAAAARCLRLRRVTRPTADERDSFLASHEAVAWLRDWWAARGVALPFVITQRYLKHFRDTGRVPAVRVGAVDVYLKDDLARLARAAASSAGYDGRVTNGRPAAEIYDKEK
jgi:hypothetical protein